MTVTETPGGRSRTVCLAILAVVAIGFSLFFLKPVLVPFLLSLFLCQILTPLINVQVRYFHFPAKLAAVTTGIFGVFVFLLLAVVAAASLSSLAADYQIYQQQLSQVVGRVSNAVPLEKLGLGSDATIGGVFKMTGGSLSGFASVAFSEVSNLVSQGVLVAMFTVFIILGRESGATQSRALIAQIERRVQRYITRTVLLSALTGALVAISLALLGVRFAVVFGLFAFLLCFIPIAGPIIATLLPLPVVLLSPELSLTAKVLAILIPALIQFVIGQAVTPKVMGQSLGLHPVTVLLFLIFFQMIWGIGGALMATPICAVVKIIFEHFPATQPFSSLMAGDLAAIGDQPDHSTPI